MRKKFAMWHAFWHFTLLNLTPTSSPLNFLIQLKTLLLRSLSRPDHYFVLLFYDFKCKKCFHCLLRFFVRVSFHFFRNKAHRISMNECAKKSLAWQRRMKQFFYDSILTVKSCHMHTFIHFLSYHLSVPVRVECAWANVIPHANYTTCKNGTGFTFFALFLTQSTHNVSSFW